jgi:hypothetical protein
MLFKLLTDGNWGDPPDFGGDEAVTIPIPGEFEVIEIEGGTGNAIKVEMTQPGDYAFRLDLTQSPAVLSALPVGSVVQGLQGTIEFEGTSRVPWIPARVLVFDGGRQVASTLSDSTGKFQVRGLDPDTYTVMVSAICFQQASQTVTVGEGAFPRLTFNLQPGPSPHSTMSVAGSFNGYSTAETMDEVEECVWFYEASAPLTPGTHDFMFVTNGFFSFPPDYGSLRDTVYMAMPGETLDAPADLVDETGATIRFQVDTAEPYWFIFNERTQYFMMAPTSVPGPGGITGTVTFESIPSAPFPAASVTAYQGAIGVETTTSDTETGEFTFRGLAPGTYRVVAGAGCFNDAEVSDIQVGIEMVELPMGSLQLSAGPSGFTSISVAGDFNGFATDALMTNPTGCIWFYDTPDSIEAGIHLFKFVTNGVFDTPPDYGGDESTTYDVPGSGEVQVVTGGGTNIKINVSEKRKYRFVLDERQRQFQIIAR